MNRPDGGGGRRGGAAVWVYLQRYQGLPTKPKLRGGPPRLGWVGAVERGVNTQIPGSSTKPKGQNAQSGGRGGGGGGVGECKYRDSRLIHNT